MTATKTGINPDTVHAVFTEFIKQARGEETPDRYADELLARDMAANELTLDVTTWRGHTRVIEAVTRLRGLTPDQQFEKGIVSMLSRTEALFISHKMRQIFGIELLGHMGHFNMKGEFQTSHRHDLIAPLRANGLIKGLGFYTIADLKKRQA